MAYRRKQGITRSSTFKEEIYNQPPDDYNKDKISNTPSSFLAARAINSSSSSAAAARNGAKFGGGRSFSSSSLPSCHDESELLYQPSMENGTKTQDPRLKKGIDMMTTSLSHIGRTNGNYEIPHVTIDRNRYDHILQSGTRNNKLQIRKKENSNSNNNNRLDGPWQPLHPTESSSGTQETQLKVSRDVAMATAAKAKVLLREVKTVKADLAFAKERCAQLEEENKRLRENRDKGNNNHDDDDLIRLQLESLLAEKARLAHENSVYARENRFLREIVEYHQLSMQDLVHLDEAATAGGGGGDIVQEVYPIFEPTSPFSPTSSLPQIFSSTSCPQLVNEVEESYDDDEFNNKDDSDKADQPEDNTNKDTASSCLIPVVDDGDLTSSRPHFSVASN